MAITTPNSEDMRYIKNRWTSEGRDMSDYIGPALEPMRVTHEHVGCVLEVFKRDYHAMSDIWTLADFARVWDGTKTVEVLVNACFECDQSGRYARVDATPEVIEEYDSYLKALEAARAAADAELRARRHAEALRIKSVTTHGTKVVITAPKRLAGTIGEVFWVKGDRVGVDVTGKRDHKGHRIEPIFTTVERLAPAP